MGKLEKGFQMKSAGYYLTKRMAEDLNDYYQEMGLKCYMHSDIDALNVLKLSVA